MKRRRLTNMTLAVLLMMLSFAFSSCGPVQSYWGVHSEYCTDGDHHHKPPKKKNTKSLRSIRNINIMTMIGMIESQPYQPVPDSGAGLLR